MELAKVEAWLTAARRHPWRTGGLLLLVAVLAVAVSFLTRVGESAASRLFHVRTASSREALEDNRELFKSLMEFRGEEIVRAISEQAAAAEDDELRVLVSIRDRFLDLHKQHLEALESGDFILAHEITTRIHLLLEDQALRRPWPSSGDPPRWSYMKAKDAESAEARDVASAYVEDAALALLNLSPRRDE